jgi:hypothetical protein
LAEQLVEGANALFLRTSRFRTHVVRASWRAVRR